MFINDYIDLCVEEIDIRGCIQTSNFSNIIINKNKSQNNVYYNWNDINGWNGRLLQNQENILLFLLIKIL